MLIYVSRMHDKLAELVSLYAQVQSLPKEVERAMMSGGISAMEKKMAELEEVNKKFKEVQSYVSENIVDIAEEVGFDTDDLLHILKQYLSEGAEN